MQPTFNKLLSCAGAFIVIASFSTTSFSNNVQIANLTLTGQNTASDFTLVQFDLSWENSWRVSAGPKNWDAVWLFVKYRIGSGEWKHASLNNSGHTAPTGSTIDNGLLDPTQPFNSSTNPSLGVFIYRNTDGSGDNNWTSVQLQWNYGVDGVADDDGVDIKVFAIEMAYIPEGAFLVGSGGSYLNNDFRGLTDGSWTTVIGNTIPFQINSEGSITLSQTAGALWSTGGLTFLGGGGTLPAAYPKGYQSIYCMKYEISQQAYVDFLNTIDGTQATQRQIIVGGAGRNFVAVSGGVYSTTAPYLPMNYLGWQDLSAYLDWSGLRPMSELEYEKICRGTLTPFVGEFAWGTTTRATLAYSRSNDYAADEAISNNYNSAGNAALEGASGVPVRSGIFAANPANTGRETSGATFYGVMEMTGNTWERTVVFADIVGHAYDGIHGDGFIDTSGNANVSNWPGTNGVAVDYRGGTYDMDLVSFGYEPARISNRTYSRSWNITRNYTFGGRGVRTAP